MWYPISFDVKNDLVIFKFVKHNYFSYKCKLLIVILLALQYQVIFNVCDVLN